MFNLLRKLYVKNCYNYMNECIPNYSNSIDDWAVVQNENGLTPNIPVNANDPIGFNVERLKVRGY